MLADYLSPDRFYLLSGVAGFLCAVILIKSISRGIIPK